MDHDTLGGVSTFLISQGVLGVACLIEGIAIWRLFNLYITTQEKRVAEAQAASAALIEISRSTDSQKELIRDLIDDRRRQ